MTQQLDLLTAPCEPETIVERMAVFFRQRPGEWLDVAALASVGGIGGFRSRIAELRFPPFSMDIRNQQLRWPDGRRRSQYRYLPAVSSSLGRSA